MDAIVLTPDDKPLKAECNFLKRPFSGWSETWRAQVTTSMSSKQEDTIEFLESALSKWELYSIRERVAHSEKDLEEKIRADPHADALAIFTLTASSHDLAGGLGMCAFRRTWQHNFAIDYVSVNPALLGEEPPLKGVGTALLFGIARVAQTLRIQKIWLETTNISFGYYARLFEIQEESDLLIFEATRFFDLLERRFRS